MKHNSSRTQYARAGENFAKPGAESGHSAVEISRIRVESVAGVHGLTRDRIKTRLQLHLDSEIQGPRVSQSSVSILGAKAVRPIYMGDDIWTVRFDLYVAVLIDSAVPFLVRVGEWGSSVQREFLDCVRREIVSGQEAIKLLTLDSNLVSIMTGVPEQFAERLRAATEELAGLPGSKSKRAAEIVTTKR